MATYLNRGNFSGNYGTHFYIDLYYDLLGQDIGGNYSTIRLYAYIGSSDGYSASGSSSAVYIDGNHVGSITSIPKNSNTLIGYLDRTIYHDGSGAGSFSSTASVNTSWNHVGNASVTGSSSLPTIPRYANITQFDVYGVDESTVGFNWNADASCDDINYSLDGGGWTGGSYPTTYIGGLGANTSHSIRIRIKRADSQLWTESDTKYTSTYDYPKPTSINNFIIGNGATVYLYNPLGRNVTLDIISNNNGAVIGTYNGTYQGNVNGEFKTADAIDRQYASISNSQSGTYYAKVTYGSSVKTYGNATYYITGNEKPNVTTTAVDSNKTLANGNTPTLTIRDLTGDSTNKTIIKYISDVIVTVSATGQKYATISSYATKYGNDQQTGSSYTYSDVENTTFTGIATDSRGLQNSADATDLTLIDYIKPTIENIELYRDNQTSSTLKCRGNGSYFSGNFGSLNNSLVFQLRYKSSDSSTWSDWETKQMTIGSGNTYSFDFTAGNSFDYTKTYNFEFKVADKCMTVTDSEIAKAGIPVQGLYENFHEAFGVKTFEKTNDGVILDSGIKIPSIFNLIYPVGSIYMSVNSTNPGTLFGGTWVAWGTGRVPVGVDTNDGDFNTVEKTGGEKSHILQASEMPPHTHDVNDVTIWGGDAWIGSGGYTTITFGGRTTTSAGGGQAHNNVQPYITCYMWKRTA